MKIAALIARILLGLVFVVFGMNKFLHFLPMQMPPGLAGQYFTVLFQSHILAFVAATEVIGGALLLINRYLTLGLVLLGPVIVNILLFHGLLAPSGLPVPIVVALLWLVLAYYARKNLSGIFAPRVDA